MYPSSSQCIHQKDSQTNDVKVCMYVCIIVPQTPALIHKTFFTTTYNPSAWLGKTT